MASSNETIPEVPPMRRGKPLTGPARIGAILGGWVLIVISPLVGIIPGPGGIPVLLAGLILVLQNSRLARRQFVRLSHRFPKWLMPLRRMLKGGLKMPTAADLRASPGRIASAMIGGFLRLIGRPRDRTA